MMSQGLIAVLVGLGIGLIYYFMSSNEEEERKYSHDTGSGSRRRSSSVYNDYDECTICLSTIQANQLVTLPCLHTFHKKCIVSWRNASPQGSCPNCRKKLRNSDLGM